MDSLVSSTKLIPAAATSVIPTTLQAETEDAENYARRAKADNALKGYAADWRDFTAYC